MKKMIAALLLVLVSCTVASQEPAPQTPTVVEPIPASLIPFCNGERATHVLVKWLGSRAESRAPYQEWIDAGVDVQANSDKALVGTEGHDVLVSLVGTNSGGFVSNKAPAGPLDATAGDFACSFLPHSDDIYYMTRGRGDFVFDAGGSDDYYMGGCQLDGVGSPGDRKCDVMIDKGQGGVYDGTFHGTSDAAWAMTVPKGRVTVFKEGPGQTHNYVGGGDGKVKVYGGGCRVKIDGVFVSCVGHVPGNGDHIHPCGGDQDIVTIPDGSQYTRDGITSIGIEFIGPESALGLKPVDQANPCAYQFSNF